LGGNNDLTQKPKELRLTMISADKKDLIPPIFSSPGLLEAISKHGELHSFKEGEIIIDIGVPIPFVPILISGSMRIIRRDEEDHELLLYFIEAGQSCASSLTCCMDNAQSEVEAIAEDSVTLIGVPSNLINEWMTQYPDWLAFVMQTYQSRFEELLDTVNSIAFTQLDKRLEKYLLDRAKVHHSETIKASHQEIANDLNSSREVISRLLKQMERKGVVKLARNSIQWL